MPSDDGPIELSQPYFSHLKNGATAQLLWRRKHSEQCLVSKLDLPCNYPGLLELNSYTRQAILVGDDIILYNGCKLIFKGCILLLCQSFPGMYLLKSHSPAVYLWLVWMLFTFVMRQGGPHPLAVILEQSFYEITEVDRLKYKWCL